MNQAIISTALILVVAATTATAATSDADMLRCAAIPARETRLDCYDGLAHQLSGKTVAPIATQAPAPLPASAPAAAPAVPAAAAQAPSAVAQAPPAVAQASPAAGVAGDPKNFGLSAAQQHTLELGPQMITANISILSSNQKGDTVVVLDNGQTWSLTDNDGWLATGQAVRIKKAAMGSYLMLIPSNHSYHVRRLK
jgi:pyruvate/2-oxoglutarate dehydrogenase complex dihydrolipoamide acyltransferase (E2) component